MHRNGIPIGREPFLPCALTPARRRGYGRRFPAGIQAPRRLLRRNSTLFLGTIPGSPTTPRDGTTKGTMLEILDRTSTPMGSRMMRRWLQQPLLRVNLITMRQNAVEELFNDTFLRQDLRDFLGKIRDIERLQAGSFTAAEMQGILMPLWNLLDSFLRSKTPLDRAM